MRPKLAALFALFLVSQAASAHRIDEYLQATILALQANRLQASMRLIPGTLVAPSVIAAIDVNGDGIFSANEQQAYARRVLGDLSLSLDGRSLQPELVSWKIPQPAQLRDGLGEIHIDYAANLLPGGHNRSLVLANHHLNAGSVYLVNIVVPEDQHVRILAQHRNPQQTRYELDYQQTYAFTVTRWRPLSYIYGSLDSPEISSLFHLGMRHIAGGTDHMLFLLTLLLPAPLFACAGRWGSPVSARASLLRILGIVTAFTIAHSLTLTLAAFGALHLPSRPIEVLIAISIVASAVNALRPIMPGNEALIAGFFGLIHGVSFASTLDRLGLGRWDRLAGILAFNLGIEAMQMLVVLAILPSLMLLSRSRAYSVLRIGGALFAIVASLGWIAERLLDLRLRVDVVVNSLARHSFGIAVALLTLSTACRFLLPLPALQNVESSAIRGEQLTP